MTTATLTDVDVRVRDAVMRQLDWDPEVDGSAVGVAAKNGTVTLSGFVDTGKVDWLYQKESAEKAVRHIRGVRGVLNHIIVAPKAAVRDVRHRIVKALHRNADVDARQIMVTVSGDTATLTGTVATWLQRDSAERAAASAPGIAHVDNRITVQSFHDSKIDEWDEIC